MKFAGYRNNADQAARQGRRISRHRFAPLAALVAVMCLGLAANGQAKHTLCSTYVYVYMEGAYQDVSSELLTSNGHTYVMTDDPFEIHLDFIHGHVYDLEGDLIGYIQDGGTPPTAF